MKNATPAPALLVVDDDEGLRLLMADALQGAGYAVETAANARETLARLDLSPPDLLVLDLKLPDGGGPELITRLQRDRAAVPFVVVTGRGDEKAAVEVMKQGALDYVMKNSELLEHLPAVVRRALDAVARDRALGAAQAEHRRLEREILDISERERQSIGADLHDNLGQQLTALELMCTLAKDDASAHPELAERLNVMSRMLREAVAQTRFLARGLVPVGAEPDALQLGLAELAERTGAIGKLRCTFECPRPVALNDAFTAGHLYRIAQEAVNNAVKHSRARHIVIRLEDTAGRLNLVVKDDGNGLPAARTGRAEGIGLRVMRHRANVIGAQLAVESRRGEGVAVRCSLPSLAP